MKHIKFSLCLLLSFSIFTASAMDRDDDEKYEELLPNRGGLVITFVGSSLNFEELMTNLGVACLNQQLIDAAQNCDITELQKSVNESNVNTVNFQNLSLLSLALKKQMNEPAFNTTALEYLISKGAFIDKRAPDNENCPLIYALDTAIFKGKFQPFEYLLGKNANPFLDNQTSRGISTAFLAVAVHGHNLSLVDSANRTRALALLCQHAKNLHEALETYDIPTISKFLNRETVNAFDERGLTPLLRVTSKCGLALQEETQKVLHLLFSHQALPNQIGIAFGRKGTPLQGITDYSIKMHDTDLIPVMLKAGADPELNPAPEGSSSSPYSIAFIHKNAPNSCRCSHPACPVNTGTIKKRTTATEVLGLFDAHLKNKASK